MGVSKSHKPNIYDILINKEKIWNAVVKTEYGDVISSGNELAAATVELIDVERREYVLRDALYSIYADYDYIFIDCPPSLELLTVNALAASNSVLIPMQCEYYALEGIADLITSVNLCKKRLNKGLEIEGILLTMFDGRTNLTNQVAEELRTHLGSKVYQTTIPRSVRLSEAPSHGLPGVVYDKANKGSKAYMQFAEEFLSRSK